MRGYRVSQQQLINIRKDKLRENLGHFDVMRNVLEEASIKKIQKYMKECAARRMEQKCNMHTTKGKKKASKKPVRNNP